MNPVVWFEIYVNDLDRGVAFFEAVFDKKLSPLGDPTDASMQMMAFPSPGPEVGGAAGVICKMEGAPVGGGGTMVYFGSEDCSVEAGRVEAAGGKLFKDKTSLGEFGFMAMGVDPDGNMFGIHSMA